MCPTITFHVDEDVKKEIEELGYDPNGYIKDILLKELKRERAKKTLNWLKKNRVPTGEKSAEDLIREDRDTS